MRTEMSVSFLELVVEGKGLRVVLKLGMREGEGEGERGTILSVGSKKDLEMEMD